MYMTTHSHISKVENSTLNSKKIKKMYILICQKEFFGLAKLVMKFENAVLSGKNEISNLVVNILSMSPWVYKK